MGPQLALRVPAGARRPRLGPDGRRIPDGCQQAGSSTIGCEDQKLGEAVHVAGTPYRLSYSSDWEPAPADRSLDVAVTPADAADRAWSPSSSRSRSRVSRSIRRYADPAAFPAGCGLPPITPGLVEHVEWDGLDGFGDPVIGSVLAHAHPELLLRARLLPGRDDFEASFAQFGRPTIGDDPFPGRGCVDVASFTGGAPAGDLCASKLRRRRPARVGSVGRTQVGLGTWDLDAHHVYDAVAGEVRLGDGTVRRGGEIELGRLRTVAGPGAAGLGGRRRSASACSACCPTGRSCTAATTVIRRTPPGGGADVPFAGNGSPMLQPASATAARRSQRSLYFHDVDGRPPERRGRRRDRRQHVDPRLGQPHLRGDARRQARADRRGRRRAVPGRRHDCRGDGGLAKDAPIQQPDALTLAPDGSIYFLEEPGPTNGHRKLDPPDRPDGDHLDGRRRRGPQLPATDPEGVPAIGYALGDIRSLLAMAGRQRC